MESIENLVLPVKRFTDFLSLFDTDVNLNEQFASFSLRPFEFVLLFKAEPFRLVNVLFNNFKEFGLKPNWPD